MKNNSIYINTSLPEDIKLRTVKTEYVVNEKKRTVAAILTWVVRYSTGSRLSEIAWSLNHRHKLKAGHWVNDLDALVQEVQTTKGLAKAGTGDEFDEKKGKRIALARAEMAAYAKVAAELKRLKKDVLFVAEEIEVFQDRAKNVRRGNKEFIQKVDSGEII